jgi:hypothetical protein
LAKRTVVFRCSAKSPSSPCWKWQFMLLGVPIAPNAGSSPCAELWSLICSRRMRSL